MINEPKIKQNNPKNKNNCLPIKSFLFLWPRLSPANNFLNPEGLKVY